MSTGPYDFLIKANERKRKIAGQRVILYAVIAAVVLLILLVKGLFQPNVFEEVLTKAEQYVAQGDYEAAYRVLQNAYEHRKNESYNKPLIKAAEGILDQVLPGCYAEKDWEEGNDPSYGRYKYMYIPAKTDPLYEEDVIYLFYDTAILTSAEDIIAECEEHFEYKVKCSTYTVMLDDPIEGVPTVKVASKHHMVGVEGQSMEYYFDNDTIDFVYCTFVRVAS